MAEALVKLRKLKKAKKSTGGEKSALTDGEILRDVKKKKKCKGLEYSNQGPCSSYVNDLHERALHLAEEETEKVLEFVEDDANSSYLPPGTVQNERSLLQETRNKKKRKRKLCDHAGNATSYEHDEVGNSTQSESHKRKKGRWTISCKAIPEVSAASRLSVPMESEYHDQEKKNHKLLKYRNKNSTVCEQDVQNDAKFQTDISNVDMKKKKKRKDLETFSVSRLSDLQNTNVSDESDHLDNNLEKKKSKTLNRKKKKLISEQDIPSDHEFQTYTQGNVDTVKKKKHKDFEMSSESLLLELQNANVSEELDHHRNPLVKNKNKTLKCRNKTKLICEEVIQSDGNEDIVKKKKKKKKLFEMSSESRLSDLQNADVLEESDDHDRGKKKRKAHKCRNKKSVLCQEDIQSRTEFPGDKHTNVDIVKKKKKKQKHVSFDNDSADYSSLNNLTNEKKISFCEISNEENDHKKSSKKKRRKSDVLSQTSTSQKNSNATNTDNSLDDFSSDVLVKKKRKRLMSIKEHLSDSAPYTSTPHPESSCNPSKKSSTSDQSKSTMHRTKSSNEEYSILSGSDIFRMSAEQLTREGQETLNDSNRLASLGHVSSKPSTQVNFDTGLTPRQATPHLKIHAQFAEDSEDSFKSAFDFVSKSPSNSSRSQDVGNYAQGRWTKEEEERLHNNWKEYFKKYPSEEPYEIFQKQSNASTGKIFKKYLIAGINREYDKIRLKAVDIFLPKDDDGNDGHTIERWSATEIKILEHNWKNFFEQYPMAQSHQIIASKTALTKEQHTRMIQMRKDTNFMEKLAKGLMNRSVNCVYQKARRHFNPANEKKRLKYCEAEVEMLKRLLIVHGEKCQRISVDLKRTPESVRANIQRLHRETKSITKGKWSNEEEQRLTDAMKECTKIHKSNNAPGQYNWDEIAAMVQTRDYYHCYQKWMHTDFCQMKSEPTSEWQLKLRRKLLSLVDEQNAATVKDINWSVISKQFPSGTTAVYLKHKYYSIFRGFPSHLPESEKMKHLRETPRIHEEMVTSGDHGEDGEDM